MNVISFILQIIHIYISDTGNILISETEVEGVVQRTYKVCDFGLSRWLGDEGSERAMVITGGIGTSIFMAPEVITSNAVAMRDHPFACDVFSYSILAYQVLAGHRPYDCNAACVSKSPHQIKQLVVQGLRPSLPPRSWPKGIFELLQMCWCEEAGDRPSFSDIVQQLRVMRGAFEAVGVEVDE